MSNIGKSLLLLCCSATLSACDSHPEYPGHRYFVTCDPVVGEFFQARLQNAGIPFETPFGKAVTVVGRKHYKRAARVFSAEVQFVHEAPHPHSARDWSSWDQVLKESAEQCRPAPRRDCTLDTLQRFRFSNGANGRPELHKPECLEPYYEPPSQPDSPYQRL